MHLPWVVWTSRVGLGLRVEQQHLEAACMLHKYKLVIGCPIMALLSYTQKSVFSFRRSRNLPFTRSCHYTWQVQPPLELVCTNTGESHLPLEERCSGSCADAGGVHGSEGGEKWFRKHP